MLFFLEIFTYFRSSVTDKSIFSSVISLTYQHRNQGFHSLKLEFTALFLALNQLSVLGGAQLINPKD